MALRDFGRSRLLPSRLSVGDYQTAALAVKNMKRDHPEPFHSPGRAKLQPSQAVKMG
jgi:hypothetical protein